MKLDAARAWEYFERAKGKLTSVENFAEGIIRVADSHMEKALRKISIEQGHDPRDFVLVSFGGAGPLHACALARAMRIPKVLVPDFPGALSAYGILVSDVIRDYSRTVMLYPGDESLGRHFTTLEDAGRRDMEEAGHQGAAIRSLDLRYAGQGYELNVAWSDDFVNEFHRLHERQYGYADIKRPVQIVNARVRMVAPTDKPIHERQETRPGDGKHALLGENIYDRTQLRAGDRFAGPAVIVEYSATTFVPAGDKVSVDGFGNLVIEVS
jgi:N-methylhydantoinase A